MWKNKIAGVCKMIAHKGNQLFHKVLRRNVLAIVGGGLIMVGASYMMEIHPEFIPHQLWECLAFTVHAIGGIPLIKQIEPIWMIVMSDVAEVA